MISEDVLSTEYLGQSKPVNSVTPVVSVCVITYNHAAFIKECLDSILMQEADFPFEIIIGEDNSTDGTREICKEYADKHQDKIRLFLRRPDQKIEVYGKKTFHFNFIENIKAARGQFIAHADGDDYWIMANKLQVQYNLLNSNPSCVLCCTNVLAEGQGNLVPSIMKEGVLTKKSLKNTGTIGQFSSWMFLNNLKSLLQSCALEKSPVIDIVVFSFMKRLGDVLYTPEVTTCYRYNAHGADRGLSELAQHKVRFQLAWSIFRFVDLDFFMFLKRLNYAVYRFVYRFGWVKLKKVFS